MPETEPAQLSRSGQHVQKSQNPNSWLFYDARIAAGFATIDALAERMGVPKATLFSWQRGDGKPPARDVRLLHNLIGVPLNIPERKIAEALYCEQEGDRSCPCGCGHPKEFSDKFPELRSLAIDAPCPDCGNSRIVRPYAHSEHRKRCKNCAYAARRVSPKEFRCNGYWDHNKHIPCTDVKSWKPHQVNKRKNAPKSRFDPDLDNRQCARCLTLENNIPVLEEKLRKPEEAATGKKVRIQSREKREELQRKWWREINPTLPKVGSEALKTRPRNVDHVSADARSQGHLFRDLKRGLGRKHVGYCRFCDDVEVTKRKTPDHRECILKVHGRELKSLRGLKRSLSPPRSGRRRTDPNIVWVWAIQYGLGIKSCGEMAAEDGKDKSQVARTVKSFIKHLLPEKVDPLFQRQSRVLREAVIKHLHSETAQETASLS